MSDSLRDQLKQAGFAETKPKARNKKKSTGQNNKARHGAYSNTNNRAQSAATKNSAQKAQQAAANKAARKAQKTAITELIDQQHVKKFTGESVYSYTLEKKIRQLFVSDEARNKLISGEWVITRLNGATYLVPEATGTAILAINPQWLVVSSQDDDNTNDDYNEFPVPDDLQW